MRRHQLWLASLVTILGGGVLLATPNTAKAGPYCKESALGYCQWETSCYGAGDRTIATWYDNGNCQVVSCGCIRGGDQQTSGGDDTIQ